MTKIIDCEILNNERINEEIYSKENPIWCYNIFDGPPPIGFISWKHWIDNAHEIGIFTGIRISAIKNVI